MWLDSVDDIAHIYLELLDTLGLNKVDVVGCSIGGWISAEMITKSPERFGKVVLVGPVGVKTGPSDKLDIPDIFVMPPSDIPQMMFRMDSQNIGISGWQYFRHSAAVLQTRTSEHCVDGF